MMVCLCSHRTWKRSVFIPIPKKGNSKDCSNYHTVAFISQASKVVLKICQARLQQYVNCELPGVQAGFRKGRGTRDQTANIHWIIEKSREFKKNIYFALLTMPKPLTVWITINFGNFWRRWECQTTWPASWETCMQVRKQQLELDMKQDWFQIGNRVCQGSILSLCSFNSYSVYIMRNTELKEAQAGIKFSRRNINNLRCADDTTLMAESKEELKSLLMKVKEEWKSWFKAQHSEN